MKQKILITGASGMVGKQLIEILFPNYQLCFLTRHKKNENDFEWNIDTSEIDEAALEGVHHIIHLAGANISEKRWTTKRKTEIIESRVKSASLILNVLKKNNWQVDSFISASAVGYYGNKTSEKIFTEKDLPGNDFLSDVVIKWEAIADEFLKEKVVKRVVKIRTGVVLSSKGGALEKMKQPVTLGVGSALGSGKQYMPWIHLKDLAEIYRFAVENDHLSGAYNAVARDFVTNFQFTEKLANILHKPFFLPPVPGFFLKLMFGEMADILLFGSRISSQKIIDAGFEFQFKNLDKTLEDLL